MTRTRQHLLENFDDEVREKLRIRDESSKAYLNQFERLLMSVTRHELNGNAEFLTDSSFRLKGCPFPGEIPLGHTNCQTLRRSALVSPEPSFG